MSQKNPRVDGSRRRFIKLSVLGGGGLTLGLYVGLGGEDTPPPLASWAPQPQTWTPNAWLRLDSDGVLTVRVNHTELGQGVTTGLPTIVAEELDVEWSQVRFEMAPTEPVYKNPAMGVQSTGASTSTLTSWDPLRQAGAAARDMLIRAAAQRWGVPVTECRTSAGRVEHPTSQRTLPYGELVEAAAKLEPPEEVTLKDPKDYRLVGTDVPRLDVAAKISGKALYAIDIEMPGMLTATVVHPPVFGDRVKSIKAERARSQPGVRLVSEVDTGVAVVADTYWQAQEAARTVEIEWDNNGDRALSTSSLWQHWSQLADGDDAKELLATGDVEKAMAGAAEIIEAEYRVPYQAHATAEPMSCVAHVEKERCRIWAGTQSQDVAQETAALLTGLGYADIDVVTTYAGGGFGRRGEVEPIIEAVQISQQLGVPVKVIWSREEDIRFDTYRPASLHRLRAGLDKAGQPIAWSHRIVGSDPLVSMIAGSMGAVLPYWVPRGLRNLGAAAGSRILPMVMHGVGVQGGAGPLPYGLAGFRLDYIGHNPGVPVGVWRGVSNSSNPFAVECFLDEIAVRQGRDPVDLRRSLLKDNPRPLAVLERAAKESDWQSAAPAGRHRGVALADFHQAFVAMVAEVSVDNGAVKVHRVVCAIDCGRVVNPQNVRSQVSGALVFGLTAAIKGRITLQDGRVQQGNFDDFPLLTMAEMPQVDVHIIASQDPPLGVGEAGVPPIAPAVANAIFAATGKRFRELPITAV